VGELEGTTRREARDAWSNREGLHPGPTFLGRLTDAKRPEITTALTHRPLRAWRLRAGRQRQLRYALLAFGLAGEVLVTTEPGDQVAAAAGASGRLRASHADREQVIDTLKAAFVQGRLTKDELVMRAGRTFASRTYADLAALTADLPAGLTGAPPPRGTARARARPPVGKVAKVVIACASAMPLSAVWTAVSLSSTERFDRLGLLVLTLTLGGWTAVITVKFASWQEKRSGGQLPPRPAHRGQPHEAEQASGFGDDLALSEVRKDARARHVPDHRAAQRTWRSLPVRRDQRWPANLQATA
jgi:hypothetical protein